MTEKICVVTGAAGGMARAICHKLVKDGLTMIGLDLSAAGLDEMSSAVDGGVECLAVDLTQPAAVAAAFATIEARCGGLDSLVNNAGTCFMSDFPNVPEQELNSQMAINFNSMF